MDKISAKHGNHKFQITRAPFGCHGADRSSIEYQHIFNDENGRNERLERFFIEEHNPAMGGYDGYPATYSINNADVSRDEYRQKKANMKDLMNPENFKNVIDKGMQQSQQKSINKANIIDKVSHNKLPFELNRMIASYDKLTVSFDVNNSFIKAIERKREQRGNACNQCAIF